MVANLLSVNRIVEKGNSVTFNKGGCIIKNSNDETIAKCKSQNGVYKFCETSGQCLLTAGDNEAMKWHRRLGHLGFQSMKKMRDGVVDGIEFGRHVKNITNCETCSAGKQSRLPFKSLDHQSSKQKLDLIHSDLMGPMETMLIGKARYILTFINDFCRKIFCYFLNRKEEVFGKFVEFKALVENQMGCKIKAFRTDNGTEYINGRFEKFFAENGIIHQKTTPYSPQQNGVAERFNRTLTEKARFLLYDAGLPKSYWA